MCRINTQNTNLIEINKQKIDYTKILIHSMLCQTQFIDPMPRNQTPLIPINPSDRFKILLGTLDKSNVRPFHKIGLIYVKNGQHDQYDILQNEDRSPEYKEFVEGLGWTVDINTHNGFLGGLDKVYKSTGEHIRYYSDATKEVIFHDITLIPTQQDDPQQLTKKRHVGNDYVEYSLSGEGKSDTLRYNISTDVIYNGLKDAGINFIVSVPCANLKKLLILVLPVISKMLEQNCKTSLIRTILITGATIVAKTIKTPTKPIEFLIKIEPKTRKSIPSEI